MGGEQNSSVNAFEMLLTLLISEKLGVKYNESNEEEDARIKAIKDSIMSALAAGSQSAADDSWHDQKAE